MEQHIHGEVQAAMAALLDLVEEGAAAAAVAFLEDNFGGQPYTIVDATLTSGNCHGLTFGAGGNAFIHLDSIGDLLHCLGWAGDWVHEQSADVLICFQGDAIAHSATKAGAVWLQTLPDGPVFTSTKAALAAQYTDCFDLSTQAGRQGLQGKRQEFEDARQALIALCDEDIPQLAGYLDNWRQQAQDGDLDIEQIRNYIDQIRDFLG